MSRLIHPEMGTVVQVDGELADQLMAAGWTEDGKPASTGRRTSKTEK